MDPASGSEEGSGGTGGEDTGEPEDTGEVGCEAPGLPPVELRFLTRLEYANTVRDLFGRELDVTGSFPPDEAVGGFFANAERAPSTTQLEQFIEAAEALAVVAVNEEASRFVECDPAAAACAGEFVAEFGGRAFRRPLTEAEIGDYLDDYDAIAVDQGGATALEVVIASMLTSPNFLYIGSRSESSDADASSYDLASRLSYFLWASMPDEALFDAAEGGELESANGVESQARRMLEDPRAADALQSFARQWLEVDGLWTRAPKDADLFEEWTPELAAAAELDTARLLEETVLRGDGLLASVLTTRDAFVNAELAGLYGVAVPAGGEGWVELDGGERSGILTRAGVIASHSHSQEVSWVHRGKLVRERFLCVQLPPPPAVADDAPLNDGGRLEDPACAGCHVLMDPIGFGFDQYDAVGAFVGGEAPGTVEGIPDPDFEGLVELSERLAASDAVAECFTDQVFAFANRREVAEADACDSAELKSAFTASGGDIRELLVSLATSNAFRGVGVGQ